MAVLPVPWVEQALEVWSLPVVMKGKEKHISSHYITHNPEH